VAQRREGETAAENIVIARRDHRPAGENTREGRHVILRITAIDAERVQLQDFAREIFVEPALVALPGARARSDRLKIVEIDEHRRMLRHRPQHVAETSEHERTNRLAFERTR